MQNRYMLFLKVVFLFLFLVLFVGCGGAAPKVNKAQNGLKKQTPSWVNGVLPNDTDRYMYGVGIGSNRQDAIQMALNDMVAKLGTTIESTYESDEVVLNNTYKTSSVKNRIKAEISKIKINNYKVIKSHRISYRELAVMVESDKVKFVNGLKESLKLNQKELQQKSLALKDSDILTRYNKKIEIANGAKNLLSEVLIISQLDPTFDKKKFFIYMEKKQKESLEETKNLKFYVSGDKKSKKFADKIKNYLAQKGYQVVNFKKGAIHIKLSTKDYIRNHIIVITLNTKILDNYKRIGGKSIIIKERYNGSKQSAYKNASIHFEQDINSMELNNFIGLNLKKD